MSTPYRSSGGKPCPRCRNVLARESDDELNCHNGCGTWLGNALIKTMVDPAELVKSNGNPFRATPLPATKCLVCKAAMNDLYKGAVDVLTFGQCVEHGIWLERADRGIFEALFAPEIRLQRAAQEKLDKLVGLDPHVANLMVRVEKLEETVAELRRELADLKSRTS